MHSTVYIGRSRWYTVRTRSSPCFWLASENALRTLEYAPCTRLGQLDWVDSTGLLGSTIFTKGYFGINLSRVIFWIISFGSSWFSKQRFIQLVFRLRGEFSSLYLWVEGTNAGLLDYLS